MKNSLASSMAAFTVCTASLLAFLYDLEMIIFHVLALFHLHDDVNIGGSI